MKKPIPFGKYLLLERINVGGMAEVFKAKAFGVEGFERLVAVKRILPSIAEDTEFITMFIDEAKIAVQLTHANIAQIFDLGKVGDSYFIAMEYVHGKDLRAIFDRARKRGEPLPVPMACYNIMKVCEGLDYAHNKRDPAGRDLHLVHRDVSPQNILISYDGEIKIIDFGIAKAAGKAGKTQAGILKGKFGYMSPEQVRGLPLDRRSDIFAVGICLYELLTGERLFVGESDFSTLEKVRNVEIMPPSTYNRRIPEELEQIVLKALAKDVDDRYQTAMDLHDDLQSFMYTSGNFFARKDLNGYMRKTFAEEIAKESARDEQYRRMEAPRAEQASGLEAFDDLPSAEARKSRSGAPPPPANMSRSPKRTVMGMGTPPPPPPPRTSGPPPPPPPRSRPSMPAARSAPPLPGSPPQAPPHSVPTPPPVEAQGASPTLDMDWDDDELSTQIYDKPETAEAMVAGGPRPAPPPRPSSGIAPTIPNGPGAPPSAGPPMTLPDSKPPSFTQPGGPGMQSSSAGAPSPFEPVAGPSLDPKPRPPAPEPTAVTRHEGDRRRAPVLAIAAAAVVLLALIGTAGYMFLVPGDPGTIHVTTDPPDAVVVFDREPVSALASPFVINNVAAGETHVVVVQKEGYRPWSWRGEVQAGQTLTLPLVRLVPEGGGEERVAGTGFTLDTRPSNARVFIDGRELDERTPIQVTDLDPGSYTIRVERGSRYAPWETQIDVEEDEIARLPRAVLNLRSVTVQFRSSPSGAAVTLVRGRERRSVGSTPTSADVELTGDPWTVEMTRTGYADWERALNPPSGEEQFEVRAELSQEQIAAVRPPQMTPVMIQRPRNPVVPPTMNPVVMTQPMMDPPAMVAAGGNGTLRINTRPWSQVYVDGRLIGNTPQMNIPLRAGSHRVTLVNSDFDIRHSITVNVPAGETVTRILDLPVGG
ncbi:MAG: serine/threonine-protein kinase [Myxococcota bacterium]